VQYLTTSSASSKPFLLRVLCWSTSWYTGKGRQVSGCLPVPSIEFTSLENSGQTLFKLVVKFMCLCADIWATCLRQHVNHCGDHTTAICKGWHSAVKRVLRGDWGEHLRVDRLVRNSA
jgi:hypothetical protein